MMDGYAVSPCPKDDEGVSLPRILMSCGAEMMGDEDNNNKTQRCRVNNNTNNKALRSPHASSYAAEATFNGLSERNATLPAHEDDEDDEEECGLAACNCHRQQQQQHQQQHPTRHGVHQQHGISFCFHVLGNGDKEFVVSQQQQQQQPDLDPPSSTSAGLRPGSNESISTFNTTTSPSTNSNNNNNNNNNTAAALLALQRVSPRRIRRRPVMNAAALGSALELLVMAEEEHKLLIE